MVEKLQAIEALWPVLLAFVPVVVWLIRGEAGTKANTREIQRLWLQRNEDLVSHREAREASNTRLEEVRSDVKEVRSDIKELLRRN